MTAEVYFLSAILGVLISMVFIKGLIRILPALAVASFLVLDVQAIDEECCEEIVAAIQTADMYNQYWLSYIDQDTNSLPTIESYLYYIMSNSSSIDYNVSQAAQTVASMYLAWSSNLSMIEINTNNTVSELTEANSTLTGIGTELADLNTEIAAQGQDLEGIRAAVEEHLQLMESGGSELDLQEAEPAPFEMANDQFAKITGFFGEWNIADDMADQEAIEDEDKFGLLEAAQNIDQDVPESGPLELIPEMTYSDDLPPVSFSLGSINQSQLFTTLAPMVKLFFTSFLLWRCFSWTFDRSIQIVAA